MYADELLHFAARLGLRAEAVRAAESPRGYHLVEDLPASRFTALTGDDVRALARCFGAALTLQIGFPGGAPHLVEVDGGEVMAGLEEALAEIAREDAARTLRLSVAIDKGALVEGLDLRAGEAHVLLFLFGRRLVHWLAASSLEQLDGELLTSSHRPTIVVVSDTEIEARGPLLSIVGVGGGAAEMVRDHATGDGAAKAASSHTTGMGGVAGADVARQVDVYLEMRDKHLSWLGFRLENLTPLHLAALPLVTMPASLSAILLERLLHLAVVYTANRCALQDGQIEAVYAGPDRYRTLLLQRGQALPREAAVRELAAWPLGGRISDRLSIVRNALARRLEPAGPEDTYRDLVANLGPILDEAEWHYEVFRSEQIDRQFELVEKVSDYVAGTAKEVATAIDGLTKGLTDSFLAAVALVVATVLASLFKDLGNFAIVKAGLYAYAAYLVLVQFGYRMAPALHSYVLLMQEAKRRQDEYRTSLGAPRVWDLFGPLRARQAQFWLWFSLCLLAFAAVAAGFVWLAGNLAGNLAWLGIAIPTPTPAP